MKIVPFVTDNVVHKFKLNISKPLPYLCMLKLHTPPSPTLSKKSSFSIFVC